VKHVAHPKSKMKGQSLQNIVNQNCKSPVQVGFILGTVEQEPLAKASQSNELCVLCT